MDPTLGAMANVEPSIQEQEAYRRGWFDILSQPENQAGLLQFGINALQPVPVGQTMGGAIGSAIGAGAQARDRSLASQNESQQFDISTQLKQDQQALQGREIETRAAGDRMQYDVGMAGVAQRGAAADLAAQNRVAVNQAAIQGKADLNEQVQLGRIYDNWQIFHPGEPFDATGALAAIRSGQGAPAGTPPASGPPAGPAGANPAPAVPAIPESLKGKPGLKWSPSQQRFYTDDGVYNQQGIPVP